jgi:hypothetical protein
MNSREQRMLGPSPVNLGANVNTDASETSATLSGDGKRLHFGRNGDIYISER